MYHQDPNYESKVAYKNKCKQFVQLNKNNVQPLHTGDIVIDIYEQLPYIVTKRGLKNVWLWSPITKQETIQKVDYSLYIKYVHATIDNFPEFEEIVSSIRFKARHTWQIGAIVWDIHKNECGEVIDINKDSDYVLVEFKSSIATYKQNGERLYSINAGSESLKTLL